MHYEKRHVHVYAFSLPPRPPSTAVVWQMMRAYTLSVLQRLAKSDKPISDPEIVEWANTTLSEAGKTSSISGFKDSCIASSMPVIDLVDAIKPGSIKYELVNQGAALSDEVSSASKNDS